MLIGSSTDKFKFPRENIMVLTDEAEDERNLPTKENIQRAMQWLSYDAQTHDSLFFHCKRSVVR